MYKSNNEYIQYTNKHRIHTYTLLWENNIELRAQNKCDNMSLNLNRLQTNDSF